ncbi:hypothetical protein NRIC_22980 [Enterococcus florum]|uniref:Uncharacterized protein n=1 Tax=Enterococcus florum TaxID=2480627 RepID=A0A4P5P8Q5_9ENTE|nr:hypothetical protein NRIC_22980 [Enterococcus florum]
MTSAGEMIRQMKGALIIEKLHQIQQLLLKKKTCLGQTNEEKLDVTKRKELRQEKSIHHQTAKYFQEYIERNTRYTQNKEILDD